MRRKSRNTERYVRLPLQEIRDDLGDDPRPIFGGEVVRIGNDVKRRVAVMKWLADWVMTHRATALVARIGSHLPAAGLVADIGSGTGHNATSSP